MPPYVDNGSVGLRIRLRWHDDGDEGGTMQVWHTNPTRHYEMPVQLGHRTNFSKNLQLMIGEQVTTEYFITESNRNHTVFDFPNNEDFTLAKLLYDGPNLRDLVNNYIEN